MSGGVLTGHSWKWNWHGNEMMIGAVYMEGMSMNKSVRWEWHGKRMDKDTRRVKTWA